MNKEIKRKRINNIGIMLVACLIMAGCSTTVPVDVGLNAQSSYQTDENHMDPPRIMLLIEENSIGSIATDEIEKMAIRQLMAKGIHVIGKDMVKAKNQKDIELLKMHRDQQGAAAIGLQFGADIVISGDAVSKPSNARIGDTKLRTYQATVSLVAIHTDSARAIASASVTETVVDIEDMSGGAKALRASGEKVLGDLIPAIMDRWWKESTDKGKTRSIEITVGGVSQMWMVRAIREKMKKDIDGIDHVTQRDYISGMVTFSIDGSTSSQMIAEELVLNPPEGIQFQILSVHQHQIAIKASAKQE